MTHTPLHTYTHTHTHTHLPNTHQNQSPVVCVHQVGLLQGCEGPTITLRWREALMRRKPGGEKKTTLTQCCKHTEMCTDAKLKLTTTLFPTCTLTSYPPEEVRSDHVSDTRAHTLECVQCNSRTGRNTRASIHGPRRSRILPHE